MSITYDDHADFQIARRGLDKVSIEARLAAPEAIEQHARRRPS